MSDVAFFQADKGNVEAIYPLSPMQQGMLFHTLYAPQSGVYVEQWVFTLRGDLDVAAFERAWQRVIERYAVLRTLFVWERRDRPLQVVRQRVQPPWEQHDLKELAASEQQPWLMSWLERDRNRGFDLASAPLMRLTLFQMSKDTWEFVWSFHHLLLDGWSTALIRQELFSIYDAFCQGQEVNLKLSRPYRDYIAWLQQQDLSKAETFWRQTLDGFVAPTSILVDRASTGAPIDVPGSSQEPDHVREHFLLPVATKSALQSLGRKHQLTLNTLLQGAWALLLSRYSGEGAVADDAVADDVVFGATLSGRPPDLVGVESMVGLFINTLPVRARVSPHRPLLPWLKDFQDRQVETRQYEYSPLFEVQRWSDLPPGRPLFESILVFENYPWDAAMQSAAPHLAGEAQKRKGCVQVADVRYFAKTNYPLTVAVMPGEALALDVSYDRRRFEAAAISRMVDHLQVLLEGIVADPQQRIVDLPLLTPTERYHVLVEWNDTRLDYPADLCIHQAFEAQTARTPGATAVLFERQSLTYDALNRRANQLAHHLRGMGVGPESCVGICVERSPEMIVGVLGILKAGGAYVPLDPDYPPERLAYMLESAQSPVLLTQHSLIGRLPRHNARTVCLDADWPDIARRSEENPANRTTPQNMAYVIFTSGSTGRPKGVVVQHRSVLNLLTALNDAVYDDAVYDDAIYDGGPRQGQLRLSMNGPLSFDTSVKQWIQLLNGHTLCILPAETRLDGRAMLAYVQLYELDVLDCTPAQLEMLLLAGLLETSSHRPAKMLVAGEAIDGSTWRALAQATGIAFYNLYGPTECTVDTTAARILPHFEPTDGRPIIGRPTVGRPLANVQVYILDRHLRPVPVGLPGELYVAGASLARGYLDRPGVTAERFVPDPFGSQPGGRMYRTGDVARYLPDGNVEFLGRSDYQVKMRGFRIELGEIEALLVQHPGVREAVVLAREDNPGDKRLVAYVVPDPSSVPSTETSAETLRSYVAEHLPNYMVPFAFVLLDALPLTPNGKVDRRALPAPEATRPGLAGTYVAPRDLVEWRLAQIWSDLLGVYPVGVLDNFFELGGHSLSAVRLMARIQKVFGQDLPLAALFEGTTVEHLAGMLRRRAVSASPSPLVAIQPSGARPPLFFVHPVGGSVLCYAALAHSLGTDQPFYGLQASGLEGGLEPYTRVEEMAAHYLEAVLDTQPEGPFFLGGWSMGGVVAFEMAQQLWRRGREVALLALLDSLAPSKDRADRASGVTESVYSAGMLVEFLRHLGGLFAKDAAAAYNDGDGDIDSLPLEQRVSYVWERAKEQGLVPPDLGLSKFQRLLRVYASNVQAVLSYVPEVYPGQITLFRATKEESDPYPHDLGWGACSTQPVKVHAVSGDHYTMLSSPAVQTLADQLRARLEHTS